MSSDAGQVGDLSATPNRRLLGRIARVGLGAAGLVLLVVALMSSWDRSERLLRSPQRLVVAFVVMVIALSLLARAWAALFGPEAASRELRHGFYVSQLGKYVPGGIWQAAGAVSLARDAGAELAPASTAFVVLAVVQVAAAATVAGLAAIPAPELPTLFRIAVIAGLASVALVHRGWMVVALRWAARVVKRLDVGVIPPQAAILRAYAWSVAALGLASSSFAVVVHPPSVALNFTAVAAFATAWWIGFVAIPFPSGIGIREAVLVGLLRVPLGSGVVLGAAVGQRLVSIAAELALIAATGTRRLHQRRRPRPPSVPGPD